MPHSFSTAQSQALASSFTCPHLHTDNNVYLQFPQLLSGILLPFPFILHPSKTIHPF